MPTLSATYLFSGMSDYWGGDGDRWDDNKGCLFAYYSTDTTLRDVIDGLVDDFCAGGDCDSMPEDITEDDVRAALVDMLTEQGRDDYESGALSEFATEFADANGYEPGVPLDDDDDFGESPVVIVLLEAEVCSECGAWADHAIDDICERCAKAHGYDV